MHASVAVYRWQFCFVFHFLNRIFKHTPKRAEWFREPPCIGNPFYLCSSSWPMSVYFQIEANIKLLISVIVSKRWQKQNKPKQKPRTPHTLTFHSINANMFNKMRICTHNICPTFILKPFIYNRHVTWQICNVKSVHNFVL